MDGAQWHKDRQTVEALLLALSKVTPDAIWTLQTIELDRIITLLAIAMGACGNERQRRCASSCPC